jgi:conjugative transposon TraN protein
MKNKKTIKYQIMKNALLLIALLLGLSWPAKAQNFGYELPVTGTLAISEANTTSLLFPYPIVSVDRGSQDVLAQKPKGVENLLQIKAAQQDFMPSNLTVVTSDGKLYNFLVAYEYEPLTYAYDFTKSRDIGAARFNDGNNAEQINGLASMAYHDRNRISITESNYDITLGITGIYIAGDYIFYRILLENETNISYDIDQLRFFVRDKKISRRTASQEIELLPISTWQPVEKVPAKGIKSFVVVLPKFTIPNKKDLYLQLTEKNGGRHLHMKVKNAKTSKVVPLPAFND